MSSNKRVSKDPRVWWATACQDMNAALHNYEGGFPIVAVSCCQSAIEKALKGYCSTIGVMGDDLGHHRLREIAEAAGLYGEMPKGWQEALVELSRMRQGSNYPYDEVEYRAVNNGGYAKHILTLSQKMFEWLMERDGEERGRREADGGA